MQSNVIRTDLLADYCGLYSANNCHWEEWVLGLSSDDLLLVRGRITQAFGRSENIITNNNTKNFLINYLSELEHEFSNWATSSDELIDFFYSSILAEQFGTSTSWHWQQEHKITWRERGRPAEEIAPKCIRFLLLLTDSLSNLINNILQPYIESSIDRLVDSIEQREYWIERFESLPIDSSNILWDKLLKDLKALRYPNGASEPLYFEIVPDIKEMANLAKRYQKDDLAIYLHELCDALAERNDLNYLYRTLSNRHDMRKLDSISITRTNMEIYSQISLFPICGLLQVSNNESHKAKVQFRALFTQLSSKDFKQHSLRYNRVHSSFVSLSAIRQSNAEYASNLYDFEILISAELKRINEDPDNDRAGHWWGERI